jgi:histone acetyltransferase (RNA polymerase elongator complex component)
MRHINIPIFIPHEGCPNDCVFCNQRTISGTHAFDISSVPAQIDEKLATLPEGEKHVELAYFGGSFTGLNKADMRFLLAVVRRLLDEGRIDAARVSTRPDYISPDIADELKEAGVTTVELGVQSMSDRVLAACRRGHTAADTVRAFEILRCAGLNVVGQMMVGLPGSTREDEINTARSICDLGACAARIYPLVVLCNTELEKMSARGDFTPLSLCEAVSRAADALEVFVGRGVEVIRIGLCASEDLFSEDGIAAGEYSPATGELVMGEVFLRRICAAVDAAGTGTHGKTLLVIVPPGAISKAAGHKGANRKELAARYGFSRVKFEEDARFAGYDCDVKIIL